MSMRHCRARTVVLVLLVLLWCGAAISVDGTPEEWDPSKAVQDPADDTLQDVPGLDISSFSVEADNDTVYLMVGTWYPLRSDDLLVELTLGDMVMNVDHEGVRWWRDGTEFPPVWIEEARVVFDEVIELSIPRSKVRGDPLRIERLNLWVSGDIRAADVADACPLHFGEDLSSPALVGTHQVDGLASEWGEPVARDSEGDAPGPDRDISAIYLEVEGAFLHIAMSTASTIVSPDAMIELTVGDATLNIDREGVRWYDKGTDFPPRKLEGAAVALSEVFEVTLPLEHVLIGDVVYIERMNLWTGGRPDDQGDFAPLAFNISTNTIANPVASLSVDIKHSQGSNLEVKLTVGGTDGFLDMGFFRGTCPFVRPPAGGRAQGRGTCGFGITLPSAPVYFTVDLESIQRSDPFARLDDDVWVIPLAVLLPEVRNALIAEVTVRFDLPDGWNAVAPMFQNEPGVFVAKGLSFTEVRMLRVMLGPFERLDDHIEDVNFSLFHAGIPTERVKRSLDRIKRYLPYCRKVFGEWPGGDLSVVVIGPRDPSSGFCHGVVEGGMVVVDARQQCNEEAHELLHLWMMGAIRIASLKDRWLGEGVAEYYGLKTRLMTGEWDEATFLSELRERAAQPPGWYVDLVNAGERSETDPQAVQALYGKGALAIYLLDKEMVDKTGDARGLDLLMQRLYEEYGRTGRAVTTSDVIEEASSISGDDLGPFIRALLDGTAPLPKELIPSMAAAKVDPGDARCEIELARLQRRERALLVLLAIMAVYALRRGQHVSKN